MPRLKFGAAARVMRAVRKVVPPRSRKPANWHWFDHPEMQARIAAAEADRRGGRVEKFDSREAAFAYLDGLA
ncbi:hypothetical protein [Longimicrobium sp.]|jgi:hypothetical protein|uniref:hypothetical protein n=1 Tax=Longimicrobium sp. TaxID=2029185 RepID=UPI002ED9AA6E